MFCWQINVVKEKRVYTKWSESKLEHVGNVSDTTGIFAAKKVLNKLHQDLSNKGFTQASLNNIIISKHQSGSMVWGE